MAQRRVARAGDNSQAACPSSGAQEAVREQRWVFEIQHRRQNPNAGLKQGQGCKEEGHAEGGGWVHRWPW